MLIGSLVRMSSKYDTASYVGMILAIVDNGFDDSYEEAVVQAPDYPDDPAFWGRRSDDTHNIRTIRTAALRPF